MPCCFDVPFEIATAQRRRVAVGAAAGAEDDSDASHRQFRQPAIGVAWIRHGPSARFGDDSLRLHCRDLVLPLVLLVVLPLIVLMLGNVAEEEALEGESVDPLPFFVGDVVVGVLPLLLLATMGSVKGGEGVENDHWGWDWDWGLCC